MGRLSAILAAIVAAAVLLAACGGGDDEPSADAGELLANAFSTPVESGKLSATAKIEAEGVDALGDGIELRVTGPFDGHSADLDVSLGGVGPGLAGGLTITEDNLWISFAGQAFELGEATLDKLRGEVEERSGRDPETLTLASLGIDVERWLRDPRVDGEGEVGGTDVTKVVADVDAEAVVADLSELAGEAGKRLGEEERQVLEAFEGEGTVEVHVAGDDTIRRLVVDLDLEVPEEARSELGGAERGSLAFDLELTDVGEPQEISPPEDARPLEDLLRQFGLSPELLTR